MSAAEDLVRSGDLTRALAELQAEVRRLPADAKLRVFLAQLLMVLGQWERAVTQLGVVAEMEALALAMLHTYRPAIECELLRREVFAGRRSPLVFGEPAEWIAPLVQALVLEAGGHGAEAAAMRTRALELAIPVPGTIDGKAFAWIGDADARLGPVLELVLNGAYYWVPFERIRRIGFSAPEDLRDLVWAPAQLTWANGGEAVGLVPVRYSGTEDATDDLLRLSRKTEWLERGEAGFAGLGQRVLATDEDEYALLDVREILLEASG